MSQDDEDLVLRDKIAIAIIPALIRMYGPWNDDTRDYRDPHHPHPELKEKAELIARIAYEIADEMRKARLDSFK